MAVRLEGAHAECVGQGESLAVVVFGWLHLQGIVVRGNLTEEPQGPGLLTLLRLRAAELEATQRNC